MIPRRRRIPRLFPHEGGRAPGHGSTDRFVDPDVPGRRRSWLLTSVGLGTIVVVGVGLWEMRTSTLQARWLAPHAAEFTWTVEPGPSSEIVFPGAGPYDERLGYSRLPEMIQSASDRGFTIASQARVSPRLRSAVEDWDLFPIYPAKAQAGFELWDRDGEALFAQPYPANAFPAFEAIPPVVWQTLLFIENRTILDPDHAFQNPAVEWPRLFRSTAELGLRVIGREGSVAGASTLATQLEKFRHAPEGLTFSPKDKLIQMASASLRGYLDGPETLPARRRIVLDYLNSVPLAAQRGEGEVTGLGDGLRAWYGRDFHEVNRVLARIPAGEGRQVPHPERVLPPGSPPASAYWEPVDDAWEGEDIRSGGVLLASLPPYPGLPDLAELRGDELLEAPSIETQGEVYREVLSLLLSQRRPSYYLTQQEGREALQRLTDRHLGLLRAEGIISAELERAAREARPELLPVAPPRPPVSFIERKAVNAVRTQLLGFLGVPRLYDLDRLDLTARTTIDAGAQRATTNFISQLADPLFVREHGFDGYRLLDRGDPSQVVYSLVLHERTERGNLVRVQTDNLDAPFNLNESARLELGSTAKLRTLASYLEVVAELHDTFTGISRDSLQRLPLSPSHQIGIWARNQILADPGVERLTLVQRAMARTFSANPGERFATGGGVQTFSNFDNTYDHRTMSVTEAFRQSVNLPFVRMMREVVNHYIYRVPGSKAHVLDEPDSPLRQEYLMLFADREGIEFMDQFIPKFRGKNRAEILQALVADRRLTPQRTAWVYQTAAPDPSLEEFEYVLRTNQPDAAFAEATIQDLFRRTDPTVHNLADLGYLASVHPLELWVARYLIENPEATRAEIVQAGAEARQEVYRWLFRTSRQGAQNQRIRSLLEVEAFNEIHAGWMRMGYPFQNIVPSLGSSIGSSGDRPSSLGDLVGIILNDGVQLPTYRVEELHFARNTPFETRMVREGSAGEQVMTPEVARVIREALVDVVENGTGRRVNGIFHAPDGTPLTVGGKTGTGDNRYRVFAPGGRLVESRSVNRTSTFVFFIGDRHYGVVTAYVPGEAADDYWFTSGLTTQILRELAPVLEELMAEATPKSAPTGT